VSSDAPAGEVQLEVPIGDGLAPVQPAIMVEEPPAQPGPTPSLKARTMRASVWTMVGYGGSIAMRFVSGVLVTKIINQGELGVIDVAMVIFNGLDMFSQVGVGQSLIQNARGDEPAFRDTGWTIQAIRGLVLMLCTMLVAWPCAWYYERPVLMGILPIVGLTAVIAGFTSTALYFLQRHFAMSKVTFVELMTQGTGLCVTLGFGWKTHSMWSVVFGLVAACMMKMLLSHLMVPAIRNRFHWDKSAARTIFHFGKWIFLSAIVGYASGQTDRLMLPNKIGFARLKVYGVAATLSEMASDIATQLTYNVLFPAFSRVVPEGPARVRSVYYRSRLRLDFLCVSATGVLCTAAPWFVRLLYDDTYLEAADFLRYFAIRGAMKCVLIPSETLLFAIGHPRYGFIRNVVRAVWVLVGVPLGWHLGGMNGVLTVMVGSEVPVLVVLWGAAIKHKVFSLVGELRSVLFFAIGLLVGWLFYKYVPQIRIDPILHQIAAALHLSHHAPP
jgi:O-antigen/teichoic acid export membrane protein